MQVLCQKNDRDRPKVAVTVSAETESGIVRTFTHSSETKNVPAETESQPTVY